MNDFKQQLAPGWTPVNIGLVVILFMLAWPLGLMMIAYIVWGEKLRLDLSRPETLSAFGRRVSAAFRAGLDTFSKHP
ncbi:MAG: DUF2852 domain-containing protein [Granulosicoccus sp.]|nr:DUF2852 domain-containing protein [Granulosicoccus sp.]